MITRCPIGSCGGTWWLRLPGGYLRLNPFNGNCFRSPAKRGGSWRNFWMSRSMWNYITKEYA